MDKVQSKDFEAQLQFVIISLFRFKNLGTLLLISLKDFHIFVEIVCNKLLIINLSRRN